MKIGNELLIPCDNPFFNDKLNRKNIADNLEKIIDSSQGSLVLSIDAGWGNGKTTFIKMWKQQMDNDDKYRTLYFNAWENDDCNDPLLALIGEIEQDVLGDGTQNNSTVEKLKNIAKPLLKKAIPSALKLATGGLLDLENVNLGDATEKGIIELVGKFGEFELYSKQKAAKSEFKKALAEYQSKENRKIIFFIDELDRCRPTFAIETLEKIKHLFNIDSYVFVLALDKKQLSYSIQTLYGQQMDSEGYLRRFIDFDFLLPEPDRKEYIAFLLEKYNMKTKQTHYFESYLISAIDTFKLSLRDIDKLFYYLALIVPTTQLFDQEKDYKPLYLEVLGLVYSLFPVLKIKNNDMYHKFVRKENINQNNIILKVNGDYRYNYNEIMNKLVFLNNDLQKENKDLSSYIIGEDKGFRDNSLNLAYLLDESKSNFVFLQQIEFVNNFTLPE